MLLVYSLLTKCYIYQQQFQCQTKIRKTEFSFIEIFPIRISPTSNEYSLSFPLSHYYFKCKPNSQNILLKGKVIETRRKCSGTHKDWLHRRYTSSYATKIKYTSLLSQHFPLAQWKSRVDSKLYQILSL